MSMDRLPVEWVPAEDDEAVDSPFIRFRIADDWFAVDADQLVMPVTVLEAQDSEGQPQKVPPNGYRAVLKQYGGERLLNDMLMSGEPVEKGTEWSITRVGPQLTVDAIVSDDD